MPAQIVPPYTWSRSEQRVKHSVVQCVSIFHDSSNQLHHSCSAIVAFSPGADQSSASSIPLSNAFLAIGTELTNLYESLLLLSYLAFLRQFWVFVHASCLWLCLHPTSQRKSPGPGNVNHSEVSTCARPVRTPKLFPLSSGK